jgi:hypothetical protein
MRKRSLLLLLALLLLTMAQLYAVPPTEEIDPGGGEFGGCSKSNCTTTYTGPTGVECCCWYQCPSGGTWVCKSGYCAS